VDLEESIKKIIKLLQPDENQVENMFSEMLDKTKKTKEQSPKEL